MAEVATLQTEKLGTLAERINAEHRACHAAKVSALEHGMEAGRLLKEVRESLPHTEWEAWLDANFDASRRTARAYMQLYKRREDLTAQNGNGVATMTLRDALKALATPYEPYGETPPGVEQPTPEQDKRQRAKERANARAEQRLMRKAEYATRTGDLARPADLTAWEAKNWQPALVQARAVREANLPKVLDILGHQLGTLSEHAPPEKVGKYLTEQRAGSEEEERRAAMLAELRVGVVWLQRVLEEAEREQGRMQGGA